MPGKVTRLFRGRALAATCFGLLVALVSARHADAGVGGIPQMNSDPGAAYTIYLDFGGFNFTGTWGNGGQSPGITPAYDADGNPTAFSTAEISYIQNAWARTAQKYIGFSVNVTTVDPAVAAGKAGSDATRQPYYDSTAQLMHTVVGGDSSWQGPTKAGGFSYIGKTKSSYDPSTANGGAGPGYHTNFVFSNVTASSATNLQFLGEASAHENGHGLGLNHQSDFTGTTLANEYSTNNDATGNGSYAPIMGNSYTAQRGTWRSGTSDASSSGGGVYSLQNDVKIIMQNPGMSYVDDSIGHNKIQASALSLTGSVVNPNGAHGWITPVSIGSPNPIGVNNYTTDFFTFQSDGINPVLLTVNDGSSYLNAGVADPGATLNSTLKILDFTGAPVGTATPSVGTLSETFSGLLSAGTYYAQVSSAGGYTSAFDGSQYYDMGAYFITGAVPEPATMMLVIPLVGLMLRRRSV